MRKRVELQLKLLWYEQGIDGMSDGEIGLMAKRFAVKDYRVALRDRGVLYDQKEDLWKYLLLEPKTNVKRRKQYESRYVSKEQ